MQDLQQNTFHAIRHELGLDRPRDDRPMWQQRLSDRSDFCQALVACRYMTAEQVALATQLYRLGRSRDGGVIFWQIDHRDIMRDGKIMHYRPDCHRDHDRPPSWVTYQLRRVGMLPPAFHGEHCLFGLHLLTDGKPVAIVESEKTAVIMSALRPAFTWMATGGKTELNVAKLAPLEGRRTILFPDTDPDGETYREWYDVAVAATDVYGQPFTVSSLLEQQASPQQRKAKIDIADLLFSNRKNDI